MILACTGHRPNKLGGYKTPNPWYDAILEGIDQWLLKLQPELVITGMALGVDQWTAELCIWNDIPFLAAVPHDNQESVWPGHAKTKYQELLKQAHTVKVISPGPYETWKMQARNKWMVDQADLVLAVWDGSLGGTSNCVYYALSAGKKVIRVELPKGIPKAPTKAVFKDPEPKVLFKDPDPDEYKKNFLKHLSAIGFKKAEKQEPIEKEDKEGETRTHPYARFVDLGED